MLVTFYKLANGLINNTGKLNPNTNLSEVVLPPGWGVIAGTGDKTTEYILNSALTLRPANTTTIDKTTATADGTDYITLSAIPSNSTITITGEVILPEQPIGTSDTITFDTAGEYQILIKSFPSLPYEVTINAN